MNLQDLEFRPALVNEGDQFISLMNKTYARKKTIEYFKWQFFDSPLNTVLMGAFLEDKLIGCFGLQCRKLSNGLMGGQAIDLIIDKGFRGRGIFAELGKNALDFFGKSLDFGFVLPNISGRRAIEKSLGWKNIATIKTMVLPNIHLQYDKNSVTIVTDWNNFTFEDNKKDQVEGLYFLRKSNELKWRFGRNTEYKYSAIKVDEAFAIVKVFVDPVTKERFGDVVDFSCDIKDDLLLKTLFCSAADYLKQRGIKKITTWAMPNTVLHKILEEIGFVESNQERYFCLKAFKFKHGYLHDISNWFLVEGDAEIY